jgi:hypothetical protein
MSQRGRVVQLVMSEYERSVHHRDTEDTEGAQRKTFNALCVLCVLCVSVVNNILTFAQDRIDLFSLKEEFS